MKMITTRRKTRSRRGRIGLGFGFVFGSMACLIAGGHGAEAGDAGRPTPINIADSKPILPPRRPVIDIRILELLERSARSERVNAAAELHPVLAALKEESDRAHRLERELYRQLKLTLPGGGEGVTFDNVKFPMNFEAPAGDWRVNFDFQLPQRGVGNVVFTGTIARQGRTIKRINGSLFIDRLVTGVQVRRVVRRGERIQQGDLSTLSTRLSLLPPDAFTSHDMLAGTAASSELRPGMWITGRMLKMPQAIRARQAVTMRLVNGGIRISTQGIAKQNGSIGEVIIVQNVSSKKDVPARIVSRDEVEVLF